MVSNLKLSTVNQTESRSLVRSPGWYPLRLGRPGGRGGAPIFRELGFTTRIYGERARRKAAPLPLLHAILCFEP